MKTESQSVKQPRENQKLKENTEPSVSKVSKQTPAISAKASKHDPNQNENKGKKTSSNVRGIHVFLMSPNYLSSRFVDS